jgi:hypothetical protein
MILSMGSRFFIPWSFPLGGRKLWEVVEVDLTKRRVVGREVGGEKHITFQVGGDGFSKFCMPESELGDYLRIMGEGEWD